MVVFQLPNFLLYLDPKLGWISWNQENIFLVKFLISMAHRWPNLYDGNTDKTDIVVGRGQQSAPNLDLFGIQYSEASLAHVRVVNMDNNISSHSLYILLCEASMFISNGNCLHGHTVCSDDTCILSHYVCDGRADCPDASDEADCSHVCSYSENINLNCFTSCKGPECVCTDLYFPCVLGGCVPWSRVCDGVLDCPHGEDEQKCYFSDMGNATRALFVANNLHDNVPITPKGFDYTCINGSNISHVRVNDLVPDCPEQDDEETYYAFLKNGSRTDFFTERILCIESDATICVKNYKDVCYPRHLHCIHKPINATRSVLAPEKTSETCRNGAHLNNCELYTCPSHFKCPSAYCIPVYSVCNVRIDCPYGEDEENCQKISCPGFLLCRDDKLCVHPNDVWSGNVKCPISMDDKAFEHIEKCTMYCECPGNAIKCH